MAGGCEERGVCGRIETKRWQWRGETASSEVETVKLLVRRVRIRRCREKKKRGREDGCTFVDEGKCFIAGLVSRDDRALEKGVIISGNADLDCQRSVISLTRTSS